MNVGDVLKELHEIAWLNACAVCLVGPNKSCVDTETGESMGKRIHVGRIPDGA